MGNTVDQTGPKSSVSLPVSVIAFFAAMAIFLFLSMTETARSNRAYMEIPDSEFGFVAEGVLQGQKDAGDAYIYDLTYTTETGAEQHVRVVDQTKRILLELDWGPSSDVRVRGVFVEGSVLMCQAWETADASKSVHDSNTFCPEP